MQHASKMYNLVMSRSCISKKYIGNCVVAFIKGIQLHTSIKVRPPI